MTIDVTPARTVNRRSALAVGGTAAIAAACAACGSSSSTATSTSTSAMSSSAAGSAAGSATVLAKSSDVGTGTGVVVDGPSGKVLLARKDGTVVGHSAVCTHQGGIVDGAGKCPLHGSVFDITTGAVQNGPATSPLAAVAVTETGGNIVTA